MNTAFQAWPQQGDLINVTRVLPVTVADGATVPRRAHPTDAGLDLAAHREVTIGPKETVIVGTGNAAAIRPGAVGLLAGRSSLPLKYDGVTLANNVGILDSPYRGEIGVILRNASDVPVTIPAGERIAQLLIIPIEIPEVVVVDELPASGRGAGGFGSTGRN